MSETTVTTQQQAPKKELAPWKAALVKAEGKFMAISGKEAECRTELGFASMLIEGNDKLRLCDQASIVNAVINVARTGITLNPILKLAHLVPRGGKCVLDFDYKGLIKILKDNNCIKDIQAIIVYGDENFQEANSPIEKPIHVKKYAKTEAEQKTREKLGVYCQVVLPDNTVIYTPFTPGWEILKAKNVSPAAKSSYSPWQTWEEEMWKKTKLKKDFKTLISGSPNEKVMAALEVEDQNLELPNTAQAPRQASTRLEDAFGEEVSFEDVTEPTAQTAAPVAMSQEHQEATASAMQPSTEFETEKPTVATQQEASAAVDAKPIAKTEAPKAEAKKADGKGGQATMPIG